ncbi:hypothetical protein AQUCO_12000029v1 [Aquilegia coerulea]|uniref:Uncharacterized protein n=1 Tax=Aquilegia coerulea TaxID=218851 RepID=A0A2G5C1Y4_AQUCA|nr:hypothetical protein AQUCO_12000029v1 [Aquilegia coerulea]
MQLRNKTEQFHELLTLNDADALLNKTYVAIQDLMAMIADTAEDTFEELLLALVKSHVQEHLRRALLDPD